jgi:hypothetical protein
MTADNTIEVPPDVGRITEGLRDTGYDFNTAVADIIDNSIAANATIVDVRVAADFAGKLVLSVSDNGEGMDRDGLINAMRFGSRRRPRAQSLGKFGLGLKTASTAFCQRLSVVSRTTATGKALMATWDLEELKFAGRWELRLDEADPVSLSILDASAPFHSGTVVLWDKIDRLLEGYQDRTPLSFKKGLQKLITGLIDHISLVYQRFLDPADTREKNLEIRVNGSKVSHWDPFCIAETKTPVAEQVITVQVRDGRSTQFTVRAFILPRKEEFSSNDSRNAARISNERQGVYVYRENRLIHGPDWMGMYKQEPHFSLLRVELSFEHSLDEAFQVDIKKSRILLNDSLYEWLRDKFLAGPRREAEVRYRKGIAAVAAGPAALLHAPSSNGIHQKAAGLSLASVSVVNAATGTVQVSNKSGQTPATIRIVDEQATGPVYVRTANSLDNGVLWEPTLAIEPSLGRGVNAVSLNRGHPFYLKAYLPNRTNSTVIQAMDYLLWALANAELSNINVETREAFEDFRVEVSRNLKKLVADLPDPSDSEN